jgi:hypothetical protein
MKNLLEKSLFYLIFVIIITSCTIKDEEFLKHFDTQDPPENGTPIQIGTHLQNPYSVTNMTTAYNTVRQTDVSVTLTIATTHYYVRFMPQTPAEYDTLAWNDSLELYDYPLDYILEQNGDYYRDPSVCDTCCAQPQYCVVPVNFTFPDVDYEILANLFLPDRARCESDALYETFINKVEDEAFSITGNLGYDTLNQAFRIADVNAGWNPHGQILVYDTKLFINVPVPGVKVRVRRWFETGSATTDLNGYYNVNNRFRMNKPVEYQIVWETGDYDIREGNWGQAKTNGPYRHWDWNLTIYPWDWPFMFANIQRGAYVYYYMNAAMSTPPKRSDFHKKITIGAHHKCHDGFDGQWANFRSWYTYPEIRIYERACGDPTLGSDGLIYVTCHELAHGAHWALCDKTATRSDFNNASDKVCESWAKGAGWYITTFIYLMLGDQSPSYATGWQNTGTHVPQTLENWKDGYTPFVIDLIDNNNQRAEHSNNFHYPPDNVTGFTIGEIENALAGGVGTMEHWKDHLFTLNKCNPADLTTLVDFYIVLPE